MHLENITELTSIGTKAIWKFGDNIFGEQTQANLFPLKSVWEGRWVNLSGYWGLSVQLQTETQVLKKKPKQFKKKSQLN